MSGRRLRDELREVFDSVSEPAHPALSARIREQIAAGTAPTTRAPRLAVAVALLTAAIVVGSLLFVSRHPISRQATPAGQPTVTASPAPSVEPGATPVPVAPAPGASPPSQPLPTTTPAGGLPAFRCAAQSGGASTGMTAVTTARAGAQSGYDRFVLEFDGPVPRYDVTPQGSATFVQDATGAPVALSGSAGLLVKVQSAQAHDRFTGSTDLRPGGAGVLREARQVGDFEGVVTWGLGLSKAACFRTFTLTAPNRLIVDVQS
jgi:hypothetical protein